jgi:Ca2+-binding EF-hand superfamily protein
MFNLIDLECKDKLSFADLIKVSDYLGFSLTVEELQHILEGIVGKGKR